MQLFTHLLSSYLQGMGDFFSALPWGGLGWGFCWLVFLPRVEVLRTSTLGYEIATPTELPGARNIYGVYSFPLSEGTEKVPHPLQIAG